MFTWRLSTVHSILLRDAGDGSFDQAAGAGDASGSYEDYSIAETYGGRGSIGWGCEITGHTVELTRPDLIGAVSIRAGFVSAQLRADTEQWVTTTHTIGCPRPDTVVHERSLTIFGEGGYLPALRLLGGSGFGAASISVRPPAWEWHQAGPDWSNAASSTTTYLLTRCPGGGTTPC